MEWILVAVCLGVSIGVLVSILTVMKRSGKMKKLIACVEVASDEKQFAEKIEAVIQTIKDPEFIAKAQILKLWGQVKSRRPHEEIRQTLDQIDLKAIIIDPKNRRKNKIEINEDSFYYLCFACGLKAYSARDEELLAMLEEKVDQAQDYFADQLFYPLYKATLACYRKQDDWGEKIFQQVVEGTIQHVRCSRQMLEVYRNLAAVFLAYIMQEKQHAALQPQVRQTVESWSGTEMGNNIMRDLGVSVPPASDPNNDVQTEENPSEPQNDSESFQ